MWFRAEERKNQNKIETKHVCKWSESFDAIVWAENKVQ